MSTDNDPYAAFRFRDYRFFWPGIILASIGMEIQAVTVGWEIYLRTLNPLDIGLAALSQFLPVLLFALPAGQIADRHDRRSIFQFSQGLQSFAVLGLAAVSFYQGPVWTIYALLLISGTARAFMAPSRSALVAQIIPLQLLPNAVTWNTSGWQFANVMGPAIGGLILIFFPPVIPYLLSGCSAIFCILLLALIRPKPQERSIGNRTIKDLLEGVRFVFNTQLLLAAITVDLFAVLLGGATALLPIYAKDILNAGSLGLGLLRSAPAIGAVLMAFGMAHWGMMRRPGQCLLLAVAGFGLVTIAFGLSTHFFLSLFLLALIGALDNISVVVRGTLMQMLTPDSMRGRVSAVNTVFISSSNELGGFESGAVAQLIGPVGSVVSGGIGTVLVVLLATWHWPQLLTLGPLDQLKASHHTVTNPPVPEKLATDA